MMPRKKLEYYANQYGISDVHKVVLTDADCERVCRAIGIKIYTAKDCGAKLSGLVDCVYYDENYRQKHANPAVDQSFLLSRMIDYAADDVMKFYVQK